MLINILSKIGLGIISSVLIIATWVGYGDFNLASQIPVPVAVFETTLSSGITSNATSCTMVTGTDKSGDDLDGYMCFVIEGGKTREEFVCGTASGTAITNMIRGIDPVDIDEEVAALKFKHRAGSNIKITDFSYIVISRLVDGLEFFPNRLRYATDTLAFDAGTYIVDKDYVDSVATSGAAQSDYDSSGLVELATSTELAAGTATSSPLTYLVVSSFFVNQTSSAKAIIPITDAAGKLSQGFLDLTDVFTFTTTTSVGGAFSASSTVHIVGAITASSTLDVSGAVKFASSTDFSAHIPTIPIAAPTTDDQVSSKKYVDDSLLDLIEANEISLSDGDICYATTAGIFFGNFYGSGGTAKIFINMGTSSPPTWYSMTSHSANAEYNNFSVPVPKDWYVQASSSGGGTSAFAKIYFFPVK